MNILVTGGAGFIGRWVVKLLLNQDNNIWILDNLSNGDIKNIEEFKDNPNFVEFIRNDILDSKLLGKIFTEHKFDICIHLAAQINVQESIIDPTKSFDINITGTQYLLNQCKKINSKFILVSTCMVYDTASIDAIIDENHPVKPTSPYAASKLSAEYIALSYYHAYKLPVINLRPFNTYGPYQKSNMEGGVVSIFVKNKLDGKDLNVFGDGNQTRDLLYVEDCAEFIIKAAFSDKAIGETFNAGFGEDISINELAKLIIKDEDKIKHVKHHHPQSEIMKLQCNNSKANKILNWKPKTNLEKGIKELENWMIENKGK